MSNKKPLPFKILSVIDYAIGLSYRKIANKLKFLFNIEVCPASIFKWVKKFQSKVKMAVERKERSQIAVDETIVKSGKEGSICGLQSI